MQLVSSQPTWTRPRPHSTLSTLRVKNPSQGPHGSYSAGADQDVLEASLSLWKAQAS